MKRHILLYGLVGGVLIALLKWSEYRFLVVEHSLEIYGGLVAATFAGLGIWLGLRLTRTKTAATEAIERKTLLQESLTDPREAAFTADESRRSASGLTRRELEILELMALGMSNREIAGKLFVSENTIKTHSSRVFDKLGAKRRTQAVLLGKELGLLR